MKVFRLKLPAPVLVRSSGYYMVYTSSRKEAEADAKSWMKRFPEWSLKDFELEWVHLGNKADVVSELNEAITDALKRGSVGL
jgi:hypothetical protein